MVTVEMLQKLADTKGASREQRVPVVRVGFIGERSNVMSAWGADNDYLFDFAYRPHNIGTDPMYDEHGLFFC